MSLPSLLTNQFIAKCFDAGTAPNTALSGLPVHFLHIYRVREVQS